MSDHYDRYNGMENLLGTDLISRRAAIEAVQNRRFTLSKEKVLLINDLEKLPSAQEESFEWCTDCKEYDQEKHCCPRWNKVIKKTIDEMKPEIVHCGECRHYVFVDDRMDMFPIRGCSLTGFRDVDAGDFCSLAERR